MVSAEEQAQHLPSRAFGAKADVFIRKDDTDFGMSRSIANSMDTADAVKYSHEKVAWRFTRHGKISRPVTLPPEQWLSKETFVWHEVALASARSTISFVFCFLYAKVFGGPEDDSKKKKKPTSLYKSARKVVYNNFNEIICGLWSAQVIGGWLFHTQISWYMGLVAMLICYLEENFRFVILHYTFHTAFWNFEKLSDMDVPQAAACRHHNGEPWVYMAKWAEFRMYFFFQREKFLFDEGWWCLISPKSIQGIHNLRSMAVGLVFGWRIMLVHRAWMIFNSSMQQIIHEWYHTPRRYRGKQFLFLYPVLSSLETVGIIDTAHHKIHHKSDGTDEKNTEQFFDLAVPEFFETIASRIYQHLMRDPEIAFDRAIYLHKWGTPCVHAGMIASMFALQALPTLFGAAL